MSIISFLLNNFHHYLFFLPLFNACPCISFCLTLIFSSSLHFDFISWHIFDKPIVIHILSSHGFIYDNSKQHVVDYF